MRDDRALWWTLRLGAALCFIGHGAFGIITKETWVPFFGLVGLGRDEALALMPVVGVVDILAGCLLLVSPRPAVLLYMTGWALWTAALRPLTGDSVFEMLERAGNYGVPFAMLLMCRPRVGSAGWLARATAHPPTAASERTVRTILAASVALLLLGHGALGIGGKPELTAHYAALGLTTEVAAAVTPLVGWLELGLVAILVLRPSASLALAIVGWKLATESLWLVDGAALWEVVERAGSYAAPLGLGMMLRRGKREAGGGRRRVADVSASKLSPVARVAAVVLLGLASVAVPPVAGAQERGEAPAKRWTQLDDASLLAALRAGGLVLACRHAITNANEDDRGPDRASQRNLSEEGRRQSEAIGRAVRAARVPIGPVLSSPMFRTRETAELAFGDTAVTLSRLLLRGQPPLSELMPLYTDAPPEGKNRVLMTHQGPLYRILTMFRSPEIAEGDCAVLRPHAGGTFDVLGKLGLQDWERLAKLAQSAERVGAFHTSFTFSSPALGGPDRLFIHLTSPGAGDGAARG
ncbi:MAG: histidine phosphatase family protein [Gemmatimonadota bacterium]|nr:histidine phosphatase family protein [Gemmatimonadota bacterium]